MDNAQDGDMVDPQDGDMVDPRDGGMANPRESAMDNAQERALPTTTLDSGADPLSAIEAELDVIAGLDAAESVELLADLTARLNHEIEVDQEQS